MASVVARCYNINWRQIYIRWSPGNRDCVLRGYSATKDYPSFHTRTHNLVAASSRFTDTRAHKRFEQDIHTLWSATDCFQRKRMSKRHPHHQCLRITPSCFINTHALTTFSYPPSHKRLSHRASLLIAFCKRSFSRTQKCIIILHANSHRVADVNKRLHHFPSIADL